MKKQIPKYIFFSLCIIGYLLILQLIVKFESVDKSANIKDLFDAFWYSLVTFSTVGYGDRFPVTVGGKILAIILLVASFGILGYLVGLVGNKISKYMENKRLGHYGTEFENHTIIIGWDDFGKQVVEQIVLAQKEVAIVCNDKNQIDLIYDLYPQKNVFVLFCDYNNYEALKKVNIQYSTAVFIHFGNDTDALVYLLNIKKFYPKQKYVVSLANNSLKETFISAGVTYCVSKDEIASKLVASYIFEPSVALMVEDLMSTTIRKHDYDIKQYQVTSKNPFCNKDYFEAFVELKSTYNSVLLGLSKNQDGHQTLLKNPSKGTLIQLSDNLVVMLDNDSHEKMDKVFGIEEG